MEGAFWVCLSTTGFTPIGTYKGKVVVSGSKFNPSGKLLEENDTNTIYFMIWRLESSEKLYQDQDMTLED